LSEIKNQKWRNPKSQNRVGKSKIKSKMKKVLVLMIAAATIALVGCKDDEDPSLTVGSETISATAAAGSYSIAVTSNIAWTATVNGEASWCTLTGASGTGNGTITVNAAENTAVETRTATVSITAGELKRQVTVTQAATASALDVDKTAIAATAAAGTYSIAVTGNTAWTATVNGEASWCTLTGASGTGNGTITVNAAENTAVETRTATVSVTAGALTRQVTVTQAAVALVLDVDNTAIAATAEADVYNIAVTSNSAWTATVNGEASWCTLTGASGTGNGAITVNAAENATGEIRTATVTVTAGTLTRQVTVTQSNVLPTIFVNVPTGNFAADCVGVEFFWGMTPALYYKYVLEEPGTLRIRFEDSHIHTFLQDKEPGYHAKEGGGFASQPTQARDGSIDDAFAAVLDRDIDGKNGDVPALCPRSNAQDISFHLNAGTYWSTHTLEINTTAPNCDTAGAPMFDAEAEDFVLKVTFTPDGE
jgi:hypothetical protein